MYLIILVWSLGLSAVITLLTLALVQLAGYRRPTTAPAPTGAHRADQAPADLG
jgi:hypothetical protein